MSLWAVRAPSIWSFNCAMYREDSPAKLAEHLSGSFLLDSKSLAVMCAFFLVWLPSVSRFYTNGTTRSRVKTFPRRASGSGRGAPARERPWCCCM